MSTPPSKIRVKCSCGTVLAVSPERAGATVACPKCGRQVAVPAAGGPNWYVARNKQKLGPYSTAQLRQLAAAGQLRPEDMVLREGHKQWSKAGAVPGLFPEAAVPGPAPAPAPSRRWGVPCLLVGVASVFLLATCVGGGFFLVWRLLPSPAGTSLEQAKLTPGTGKGDAPGASGKPNPADQGAGTKEETPVGSGAAPTPNPQPKRALDLKYIPADASAALVVHPRPILQSRLVAGALPAGAADEMVKELGVRPEQVEQVIVLLQVGAPGPASAPPPKDTWVALESKEGGFSLRFPVQAKQSERKTPLGIRQVFTAEADEGNTTFELSYVDFPKDSPIVGDLSRVDYGTRALEFKPGFKDKKDIKLDNHLGAEVVLDDPDFKTHSVHRVYVVGDRLYELEATTRKAQKPPAEFTRFFDSFKVAGATAPAPEVLLPPDLTPLPAAILRFADPVDGKQLLGKVLKGLREAKHQDKVYYVGPDEEGLLGQPMAGYVADDRTLLLAPEPVLQKMLSAAAEKSPLIDRLRQADANDDLTAIVALEPNRKLLNALGGTTRALLPPPLAEAATLPNRLVWVTATAKLDGNPLAQVTFEADNEESAQAVEKLVQAGLVQARQVYPEGRAALVAQLPPATVPALLGVMDQLYGGVHVTRAAARVSVTVDRPPVRELPADLIAAAGFNDAEGLLSDPVPDSPYPLDTNNRVGGIGEPGWAGPWAPVHPAATFQKKVVFEGDGALYLTGEDNVGPGYSRRLAEPQRGVFQVELYVQVPAGARFSVYLKNGEMAFHEGPVWNVGDGKFQVAEAGVPPDTGFACRPGKWYKVSLRVDMPKRQWEFSVDDKRFVPPQPLQFRNRDEPQLDTIAFLCRTGPGVYIDALRVTRLPSGAR
jgi:hypothetical protein